MKLTKVAVIKRYLTKDAEPIASSDFIAFYKSLSREEREQMANDAIEALRKSGEDVELDTTKL